MSGKNLFKHWKIKVRRYIFRIKYLPVVAGPLKGFLWSTGSSYDYLFGKYEDPKTVKTFLSWLNVGSVYYDIGANVGFHSLTANAVIKTGKIYAFEPMPAVREVFKKHISLNQKLISGNCIEIIPIAVSNTKGEVEFSNDEGFRDGNTYIKQSYVFSAANDKISVQCNSIDGLIAIGYKNPDVIKIDVEGAEYDVLTGAKQTLEKYKPNIILSTHDCHLPGVQKKCVQFLEKLGYSLQHTGKYNKHIDGLDDYIAIHKSKQ